MSCKLTDGVIIYASCRLIFLLMIAFNCIMHKLNNKVCAFFLMMILHVRNADKH